MKIKNISRTFLVTILLLPLLFAVQGCDKEGPIERAGESIDEGIEEATEDLDDNT